MLWFFTFLLPLLLFCNCFCYLHHPLSKKCPNAEFSLVRIFPYYYLLRKSPYSVQIRETTDQKNLVFGNFSRTNHLCEHYFSLCFMLQLFYFFVISRDDTSKLQRQFGSNKTNYNLANIYLFKFDNRNSKKNVLNMLTILKLTIKTPE